MRSLLLRLPMYMFLLLVFTSSGQATAQITEIIDATGDGAGNVLDAAAGVALDASGNVYVSGRNSINVFKITPVGTVTKILDATGDGAFSTLNDPLGLAVDSNGNIYVAGGSHLFRITPSGTVTAILSRGALLLFVAVDSSGNVYATSAENSVFKIATPGGCSVGGTPCTITEIIDATGDGAGNVLNAPFGVAVDPIGNVYVTGGGSDNAFKIATPGGCSVGGTPCIITEIIDTTGDGAGHQLIIGNGVAVGLSGNVYVIGGSANAFKIETPGTCSTQGTPCTITEIIDVFGDGTGNSLVFPQGVAVDSADNVYVAGQNSANAFKIATPASCSTGGTPCTITQIIDATGDGVGNALNGPLGLAVDPIGNVYVAGLASDNAFRISLSTSPVPSVTSLGVVLLGTLMGAAALRQLRE